MHRARGFGRANALRLSLLTSLGLFPFACGGSVISAGDNAANGGGTPTGNGTAGASPIASGAQGGNPPTVVPPPHISPPLIAGASGMAGQSPRAIPDCVAPTVDPITQLVKCADGTRHRPQPTTCGASGGTGGTGAEASAAGEAGTGAAFVGQPCQSNDDCASLVRGYCSGLNSGPVRLSCASGCLSDADCGPGALCYCNGSPHFGECAPAACHVDSDCAQGSRCADAYTTCGITPSFACVTVQDECLTYDDCIGREAGHGGPCQLEGTHRTCGGPVCGRPFLVAEYARVAELASSPHWLSEGLELPELTALSPSARSLLAAHWASMGQMEHASIAAFARFNLQLLSLGAPARLVEGCNRAIVDETKHAKLCFALASHYGGTPVGPARLDVNRCLEASSLLEVMKLVLREGCLGETSAALEALEAADLATDPSVKRVLTQIAQDEQRHAELAFQFLIWALDQSSESERSELADEARAQARHVAGSASSPETPSPILANELAAHGLLSHGERLAIRKRAVSGVASPLIEAILRQEAPLPRRTPKALPPPDAEGFAAT